MDFTFHQILIFFGALQGFFLSAYLFTNKSKARYANSILGLLMLTFSLNLIVPELAGKYYEELPHLLNSSDSLLFLFGPLVYLYSLFITGRSNKISRRDYFHFVPFILVTLAMTPFLVQSSEEKLKFVYSVAATGQLPTFFLVIWIMACVHIAVYMLFTYQVIITYRDRIMQSLSNLDKVNLQWLKYIVLGSFLIWILDAAMLVAYLFQTHLGTFTLIGHILGYLAAFFIYFIGYKALKQPEVFIQMEIVAPKLDVPITKYNRSGLTDQKAEEYKSKLLEFMEDESPYLNPDITLTELATSLAIPNNHLSQVINEKFDQNFFDFINYYRVCEAKTWLADPVRSRATMLAIAFESGFKSKSTFNAAFKKHTNQTPSEFKNANSILKTA